MFRHVALWKFTDDCTPGERREEAIKIKAGLEELAYEVHGVLSIDVHIDPVREDNDEDEDRPWEADILADCRFENRDAFRAYLEHQRRKAVETLIEACAEQCLAMDFEGGENEDNLI